MKLSYSFILLLLLFTVRLTAQPAETIYDGTVIATGFKQSLDASSDGPFPIGFSFTFFGNSYSQFYISVNGLVMFSDPDGLYNTEVTIPAETTPNDYIGPFWDNLSILSSGNIMYKTVGAAPNRKCVIQFKNMGFDPIPNAFGTFQVILYETSNNIQVQYRLIVDPYSVNHHGGSATIGLENSTGTAGVLYAFHNNTAVYSEDAISFTPSGPTYTMDDNAMYDGVFLTTNLTLPDPGIATLLNPALDAVIGSDQTFEWSESTNASTYYLLIDTLSSLATAKYYYPGLNLSQNVTGLLLDKTYYWAVYASNSTASTWCEVKRFTTSSTPPLAPGPQTVWAEQNLDKTIKLSYTGGDASPKTAIITSLPAQGTLWQYNAGVKGSQITLVPATVTDAGRNVIYTAPASSGNGIGNFNYKMNDAGGDSPEATITVNVSPPGIPSVLYIAKGSGVEIQFDRLMSDPAGKHGQFTVTVNGSPATITTAALKTGDPYTLSLGLSPGLTGTETVLVSYTQGDVTSAAGGFLLSFTDQSVTLRSQTISFTQTLDKKFNESPFNLTATASSGLGMTYSSSNLSVATISSNVVTLKSTGASDITARQAGNATWAPAKYVRTMTVGKADQTITFGALPDKVYGDDDFSLTAGAGSLLLVSFVSSNLAVATVAGNTVHIVGAGSTTITASQGGNANWNPAPDVPQSLTVNKADQAITFGALPDKVYGDDDFSLTAGAGSLLLVSFVSSNLAVATVSGNTVHIVGAGTTTITASQAGDANWNAAPDVPRTLTVNKASLTVTADNKIKTYGDVNPALTVTYTGFVGTDDATVLDVNAAVTTAALQFSDAGTYTISASGGSDNNYSFSLNDGTLTVSKATLTITADNKSKIYGAVNPALTVTYTGFVGTDDATVLDVNAAVTTAALQFSAAGLYPIVASGGSDNNYVYSFTDGVLTINKADQTITFSALTNKVYGDADFTLSAVAGSSLLVTFVTDNPAVATVAGNVVHIVGAGTAIITASQGGDGNYNAAPSVPQTLTVGKKSLTFTADNKSKVHQAQNPVLTYTSTGYVLGETQPVLDVLPAIQTAAVQNSPVGTYPITITGGSDNNYTYWYIAGVLTVTRFQQTISFTGFPVKLLVEDSFTLAATSSSGLTVLFESMDLTKATVTGNQLTGVAKGNVQVRAYHPGDLNFDPAESLVTVEIYSTHKDIMYLFTPNNDGINDLWELPDLATWGKCDLRVYNRWGKLVFANANYNNTWNGTSNGNPVPEGPYYFIINTQNAGVVKGTVNVVR